MGTQWLGGRGHPAMLGCGWHGAGPYAWHICLDCHRSLLTLSSSWDGAPCPPHTTSSTGPCSCLSSEPPGTVSSLGDIWRCLWTPSLCRAEPLGHPGSGKLPHILLAPNPPHHPPAQPHLLGPLSAPKPISCSSENLLPPL